MADQADATLAAVLAADAAELVAMCLAANDVVAAMLMQLMHLQKEKEQVNIAITIK